MKSFAILGTGSVGQTLAGKLDNTGHKVFIGTRNIETTLQRTVGEGFGSPPFSEWHKGHKHLELLTYKDAAARADVLINCTAGMASLQALSIAGADKLNKVLIDIANPLDFSQGFPPSLSVCNTHSLAEEIQAKFPSLRVVKTLNTMSAPVMVNPSAIAGNHAVFLSGNDLEAKNTVKSVLRSLGWKNGQMIDLGDLSTARGTEMLLPVWLRLYGVLGTPMFNFSIALE